MLSDRSPFVSVLMTSYNREKFIAESIESVLDSDYTNFELIIVDDASQDNTLRIARAYEAKDERIKIYVNSKNLTQWPTRNKAAALAKGKYIKYLDSDDLLYKGGLRYCVEMMEAYPEAAMGLALNNPQIDKELFSPNEAIRTNFFKTAILNIGPSGTILRKNLFERVGFYNPNYGVPSDMYFNLMMASLFPVILLKNEFFFYRRHESQEYNNKYSYLLNNYKYLKDVFEMPGFQLSDSEKNMVLLKAKKSFAGDFLNYIKNTGEIKKAIKAISLSGLGISGFASGLLQYSLKFLKQRFIRERSTKRKAN